MEQLPQKLNTSLQTTNQSPVALMKSPASAEEVSRAMELVTPVQAIQAPVLRTLEQELGSTRVLEQIFHEVKRVNNAINVDQRLKLSDPQCAEIAVTFLTEFYADCLEDIIICFRRALTGAYGGKVYHVDSIVIFDWFRKYLAEKAELMERRHKESKEAELAEEPPISDERLAEIIKGTWAENAGKDLEKRERDYRKFHSEYIAKKVLEQKQHGQNTTGENPEPAAGNPIPDTEV